MIKTASYLRFEEGFIKEAGLSGCNVSFLRGYIKQADEIVDIWKNAFDELAKKSGDSLYHYKMANELLYAGMLKEADWRSVIQNAPQQYQSFLGGMNNGTMAQMQNKLQSYISSHNNSNNGMMNWLSDSLKNNPNLLSSLASGGGGGGLLGLLLGAAMGHPMMGLMMGGLGGAGIGAFMGNQKIMDAGKNFFNPKPATEQANTSAPNITQPIPPPIQKPMTPSKPITPPQPGQSTIIQTNHGF